MLTHVGTLGRECKPGAASRDGARGRWRCVRNLAPMAEMHDTTEEYLESILAIEEEGVVPMRARLVERLGLSAAAVSETIGRLSDHGYVELHGDRSLHLTDKGRASRPPSCAGTGSPSGCSST